MSFASSSATQFALALSVTVIGVTPLQVMIALLITNQISISDMRLLGTLLSILKLLHAGVC